MGIKLLKTARRVLLILTLMELHFQSGQTANQDESGGSGEHGESGDSSQSGEYAV